MVRRCAQVIAFLLLLWTTLLSRLPGNMAPADSANPDAALPAASDDTLASC